MTKYLLSALLGAAIVFFLMRGCEGKKEVVTHPKNYDSLLAKAKRDSISYNTRIAGLETVAKDNEDAAKDAREQTDSIYLTLSDRLAVVNFTNAKLRTAREGKDEGSYHQACDSLEIQSTAAMKVGLLYKSERDTLIKRLDNANAAIKAAKDEAKNEVTRLYGFNNTLKATVDTATQIAKHWQKVAGKKWSLGITGGYGVGKNGLTPVVSVGVSYSIIRF